MGCTQDNGTCLCCCGVARGALETTNGAAASARELRASARELRDTRELRASARELRDRLLCVDPVRRYAVATPSLRRRCAVAAPSPRRRCAVGSCTALRGQPGPLRGTCATGFAKGDGRREGEAEESLSFAAMGRRRREAPMEIETRSFQMQINLSQIIV
jgi:hypothetical protein